MRITRIIVRGLFDRFNHDLNFKGERIAIMIGPNGFGKTWILRIVSTIFARPLRALLRMPFREVSLHFDDDSTLTVTRQDRRSLSEASPVTLALKGGSARRGASTTIEPQTRDQLSFPLEMLGDLIPELVQTGPTQWRHRPTGELLDIDDVLARFGDELPQIEIVQRRSRGRTEVPEWLSVIREAIPVRTIDTERLTSTEPARTTRRSLATPVRTVSRYSEELGQLVQKKLAEYATLSQSLDRTFPARLVEAETPWQVPLEDLRKRLTGIEEKRKQLVDAGLLVQERGELQMPQLDQVGGDRAAVLGVFASDAEQKLAVFDDLYARVETFRRIANSRLQFKRVNVGRDGLSVVTAPENAKLSLELLSSGEQHELVFLYEFLFHVRHDSLILFDEPELSLHVAWLDKFLADLEEMAKLSNFSVLMATHSPQIIGDRWDLTIELKGPNGNG